MNDRIRFINGILFGMLLIAGIFQSGCATNADKRLVAMAEPDIEPVLPSPQVQPEEGTVYEQNSGFMDLFTNPKAKKAGDIITIKIVENSSATNNAVTNTGRNSSLSAQMNSFFNFENKYNSAQKSFNPFGAVQGGMESEFEGTGTTSRSGDLTAYITAKVTHALPNGNLMISGTREVQINHEKQYITLNGLIRPRDISPDNVILSTYISDAKIAYSGTGIIDQRQKPGWMANILNKAWPF